MRLQAWRDGWTLVLASLVAAITFVVVGVVSPALFTGGAVIYAMFVAWAAGSLFALSRQPRYGWLQVALLGVLIAAMLNGYIVGMRRIFPPPTGVYGGPNTNPPQGGLTPVPPR